ncbi:HEPN-associated N-terminal domain-containing protein [Pedobacter sp. Leaf170]|uniref:HEPN-associated N-terminal domain-containing protein n=1 Tax=Pedobacter sp. Leaf170 TaxID=2876558 RepID=UPI001E3588E4|nr:HEPN-associated N-terminal domain-containing protein [Pedobacter sp. Leaf170]
MGQAKKHYEQMMLTDSDFDSDKCVCANHIHDKAIYEAVVKDGEEGICSYCNHETRVILVKDLIDIIKSGIFFFYGDANDEGMSYESEEGGYFGASTFDTEEMFYDAGLEIDNDRLRNDISEAFGNNVWCERDPYADRENTELTYNWNEFKQVVKHKSRYVFLGSKQFQTTNQNLPIDQILNDIGIRADDLNLFSWLKKGTSLLRCRQHGSIEILNTEKQLAAPPDEKAIFPNRMSPAGISMFYCAFDKITCHLETVDPTNMSKEKVTTGIFKNKEDLYLLDLTKVPELPSIFDKKMRQNYYSILFLKSFVDDLTQSVTKDGRQHIDYVPTQIITEYFRYTYNDLTSTSIDGILYPSSKSTGKNACVLFYNHKQSLELLDFDTSTLVVDNI